MTEMKPILFNTEMVREILGGRKTQTRRLIKGGDHRIIRGSTFPGAGVPKYGVEFDNHGVLVSRYQPGDDLYIRETWAQPFIPDSDEIHYRADYGALEMVLQDGPWPAAIPVSDVMWRPSIHMPKEAARIFLHVTDVRAERLQSVTEVDAQQEGAGRIQIAREVWSYRRGFRKIWDNTVKPADLPRYGWDANPWVWVIEFERCEKPEEKP